MSNTGAIEAHEFMHDAEGLLPSFCALKLTDGKPCNQQRDAAIHRLPSDTEGEQRDDYGAPNQHCEFCRKEGICAYHRDIDAIERKRKERYEPPTDTQDAPPEPPEWIWIDPVAPGRMYWIKFYEPLTEHLISYTRSSTVESLAEALRKLIVTFDIGRDIYWAKMNLPRPSDDDTEPIASARTALARWEGKKSQ